ncbi:MAG: sensor histidine kinase [Actinobacteria bacterium]|nr:MAG: sensor histidine kinase [Actinomycetota bacterium]
MRESSPRAIIPSNNWCRRGCSLNMNQQSARWGVTRGISLRPSALRGRWLLFFRAAWIVLAVIVIGLDLTGIPYAYEQSRSALSAENARELRELGISREFYAAYDGAGLSTFVTLVFFAVAAVIFWRRSQDPMALFGSFTLLVFGGAAVTGTMHELADARPTFWFPVNLLDYVGQVAFSVFFYLFPDGRFVPRWTRWLALAMALLFVPTIFFPDSLFYLFRGPFFIVFIGSLLFAQVYRYRRVSNPMQRQQTKWVVFGSVVALAGFSVIFAIGLLVLGDQVSRPLAEMILRTLIFGFILLIPLSIGVAVLRHRLYDIDLVVNRTLVYGALTACVVGIYVLVVGYLGALFRVEDNLLVSLAATGVVAVVFAPMRHRLQRAVNRLMYGERDDPYGVISRLGQRLEATLDPRAVLPAVAETVAHALKLPHVAIELKRREAYETAAEYGRPVSEALRLPLVYGTEMVGRIVLSPRSPGESFTPADKRLLDDLARQAGIAAHAVRLTDDLQRSREHLVTAREEERRRMRRNLHDGLGPALSSTMLKLGAARRLLPPGSPADDLIVEVREDIRATVADVRRLVYDLRPPALDQLGLVQAIRDHAEQYTSDGETGLRITVEASEHLPPLPAAVEVAAYHIAREAITNAARHSQARSCHIRLVIEDAPGRPELVLEITDDGVGLPTELRAGVGLSSMRERAEELGGTCAVGSSPGGGAHVLARLPLGKE